MSLFESGIRNALPLQSIGPLTSDRLLAYLAGPPTSAGPLVNEQSVMGLPAAYDCVRILAEGVASLPLITYERLDPRGRREAVDHPLYRLLKDEPNGWMSSVSMREALMGQLALRGNCFAEIELGYGGTPIALWPLRADKMLRPIQSGMRSLLYPYTLPDGSHLLLPQHRVLHVRGVSSDGLWGFSPLTIHREAFGYALAAREYGARFFGQGARPGGVLQAKGQLSEAAAKRMRESWEVAHSGLSMSHRVAVLEEGVEWKAVGMSNDDAQYIEVQNFSLREIARIFRIPPHKMADLNQATFSNIEQQALEFVTDTLMPWLVRWEQEYLRSVFLPQERSRYYAAHLVAGLLRGDVAARVAYYSAGINQSWLSPNDVREMEELNPIPGERGNVYFYPANMTVSGGGSSTGAAA